MHRKKTLRILLLSLVQLLLLKLAPTVAVDCPDVDTSEGRVTLRDGQKACGPLFAGEGPESLGRRFLTCFQGRVYVQNCALSLRFDTESARCTYPDAASCKLQNQGTTETPVITPSSTPLSTKAGDIIYPDSTVSDVVSTRDPSSTIVTKRPRPTTATTQELPPTTPPAVQTDPPASTVKETPPTGSCNPDTCKLPRCFCHGAYPNLPRKDTPQFIMLTFDDAITSTVYDGFYRSLLVDNVYNLRNPGGCSIRSAFYVNHQYTDYTLLQTLANLGHEIASHTVNHSLPMGDSEPDYPEALAEIVGMRKKVLEATGNKTTSESLVGFRAPYLRVAHNVQFDALVGGQFLYDTSITNVETYSGRPPVWAYTLDYPVPECPNAPCPTKSYPGLWEMPINSWLGSNGYPCSMIDMCSVGTNVFTASEQEWYDLYKTNFDQHFNPVKVPMHLFTHASMFLRSPSSFPALVRWFQDLLQTNEDVWIVSPKMVIDWLKYPLTNAEMIAQNWGC